MKRNSAINWAKGILFTTIGVLLVIWVGNMVSGKWISTNILGVSK